MSFFGGLFRTSRAGSLAFINVGAGSVAGAFAHYPEQSQPLLAYARRVPIEVRSDEPHERAMFRALEILGQALISEGAPALARVAGSGSVASVVVAVDAPWQETAVRTERFEGEQPFTFTKKLIDEAMLKVGTLANGKILCDESIIGTMLNGYETKNPFGKKAKRASVIVLASSIDHKVAEGIRTGVGRLFHTKEVRLISGSSLRYQAIRMAFPHEENALILDATGPLVALSLIRNGLLVSVLETPDGAVGGAEWAGEVTTGLSELAKQFPLPRTIFLLVRDADLGNAEQSLAEANLGSLWLSDIPPKIVAVQGSHLTTFVKQASAFPADLSILLMALYGKPWLTGNAQ